MESEDQGLLSLTRAFNKLLELYNDNPQECIAAAHALLQKPDLPRYHRIKTLILLGSASEDWDDAETCRLEAGKLWDDSHHHYSRIDDPGASQVLAELRAEIDAFAKRQREELEGILWILTTDTK
ncbi:hypothetical protein VE03_04715 [Pseudogymnoascus sp. 23342-1-I1]|nr:hypothetical protein VE03_04715 [Pseudogymnoascus sp. 23342-1-I1]